MDIRTTYRLSQFTVTQPELEVRLSSGAHDSGYVVRVLPMIDCPRERSSDQDERRQDDYCPQEEPQPIYLTFPILCSRCRSFHLRSRKIAFGDLPQLEPDVVQVLCQAAFCVPGNLLGVRALELP